MDLVGYRGERCIAEVEASPHVTQHLLGSPFARLPRALFLLYAPFMVLFQVRRRVVGSPSSRANDATQIEAADVPS